MDVSAIVAGVVGFAAALAAQVIAAQLRHFLRSLEPWVRQHWRKALASAAIVAFELAGLTVAGGGAVGAASLIDQQLGVDLAPWALIPIALFGIAIYLFQRAGIRRQLQDWATKGSPATTTAEPPEMTAGPDVGAPAPRAPSPPGQDSVTVRAGDQSLTVVAESGATVNLNVYVDGLHEARGDVRDPFEEGRRLQQAEQHEAAIGEFEKALAAAEDDSQRCALHILMGISSAKWANLAQADGQFRRALQLSERAADSEGSAAALGNLGNLDTLRGEPAKAEKYYKRALALSTDISDRQAEGQILANLGIVYRHTGKLTKAQHHLKQALAIHEAIGNRLGQANALVNLGIVYSDRGHLHKAEGHYKRGLVIHQELSNRAGQAAALGNLGLLYARRGDFGKAEEHHRQALTIDEEIGNRLGQARALGNLGNVYRRRGDLDNAEEHHKWALAIDEEIDNRLGRAQTLANLGLLAAERGQLQKARQLLSQAQALYAEIGAGGEGPDTVRAALEHLEGITPPKPKPKRKRTRKKPPPKKP